MRDHSHHIEMTRDQAVQAALEAYTFTPRTETVSLAECYGRVLASDVTAKTTVPNSLTCAMDSVAVHWSDFADGMPDTSDWERGKQWEFANTGVGMPEGFDTAIVVEHVHFSDNDTHVSFDAAPSKQYAGTIPAGSRFKEGDVMVHAGAVMTPLLASSAAASNNTTVEVIAKPVVEFIPSGNELVSAGGVVPRGKTIDSNSDVVRGKIEAWGGTAIMDDIVPDDPKALEDALRTAAARADIVVLNAGSSKGSDDYSMEVLERIGKVICHQTNHGPGHHSSYAVLDNTPVVGISGPPSGVAFTTDFYLWPVMRKYLGLSTSYAHVKARLASPLPGSGHKPKAAAQKHLPGEKRPKELGPFFIVEQVKLVQADDGVIEAHPLSGVHIGAAEADTADAYYMLPAGADDTQPNVGDFIQVDLRP